MLLAQSTAVIREAYLVMCFRVSARHELRRHHAVGSWRGMNHQRNRLSLFSSREASVVEAAAQTEIALDTFLLLNTVRPFLTDL
jgi:hypothetical protein